MTTHVIFALGNAIDDAPDQLDAYVDFDGNTDTIDVPDGATVAHVLEVHEPAIGLTLAMVGGSELAPGDSIVVTGSAGSIPDFQVGLSLTVDDDGIAHLTNAGPIAAAITLAQS